jgi:hypothetical protein
MARDFLRIKARELTLFISICATSVFAQDDSTATSARKSVILAPESPDAKTVAMHTWHYAALAAHVYDLEFKSVSDSSNALASPWLKRELKQPGNEIAKDTYSDWDAIEVLKRSVGECSSLSQSTSSSAPDYCANAKILENVLGNLATDERPRETTFIDASPNDADDCDLKKNRHPRVPITRAKLEFGWEPVPEFIFKPNARGWRIFVPEFELEVWRRPILPPTHAEVTSQDSVQYFEYAISFRGTAGSGGWLSNFRVLTALTPFVWDQYRQSTVAAQELINRIYAVHALADFAMKRKPSKIYITTVGHSLGGAMAQHVYFQLPQISKAVAFNSSPFNGASLVKLEDRELVFNKEDRVKDQRVLPAPFKPATPIVAIFEQGEILSLVSKCVSGPIWGAEGGPKVDCFGLNLSSGNIFSQHSMAQFACKLSLLSRGIPTR